MVQVSGTWVCLDLLQGLRLVLVRHVGVVDNFGIVNRMKCDLTCEQFCFVSIPNPLLW